MRSRLGWKRRRSTADCAAGRESESSPNFLPRDPRNQEDPRSAIAQLPKEVSRRLPVSKASVCRPCRDFLFIQQPSAEALGYDLLYLGDVLLSETRDCPNGVRTPK